ncbi:alkaline shock response membrane anchor protein AmaP [Fuchsiella alkaliacetigena]|uniref:alkaline shock response membrane anchor protein AmaP n=1 Tax=Fuchsiella alkaliacetigena TaxID=957042 RepID=UPI002009E0A9|nr:alkaline shock response membrane anchor protein AmaP [Fuchsiella alkaliacetigena]MCK8825449.1 alkaline shock response membrane anchor protein AmaP [Fuchsiella alkaliacetigena]
MEIIDRIVIVIFTIVLIFLSLLMILTSFALIPQEYIVEFIIQNYARPEVAVVGAVFLLIALRIIAPLFKRNLIQNTIVQQGSLGQISISLKAIDSLVTQVISQTAGVKLLESKLEAVEEGLQVFLEVSVNPGLDIPQLTEELQTEIKDYLHRTTGVAVIEVKLLVRNITETSSMRLE